MFRFVSFRGRARVLLAAVGAISFTTSLCADVVDFASYQIDVDATVGTGANASVLVVDWDIYGGPYNSPAHAFLYQWDGSATLLDMLTAFQDAGVFTFTGTAFIGQISYTDADGDSHANPSPGNWELASGTNPFGTWEGYDPSNLDWDFNAGGADVELLADGQFEGMNAAFWDPNNNWQRVGTPLSVPVVPEPTSVALLTLSGAVVLRRRRA